MMNMVGIEFVGGPLDGQQRMVPVDLDDMPQEKIYGARLREAEVATPGWYTASVEQAEIVYERHPSPRAYGPLWLYLMEGLDL